MMPLSSRRRRITFLASALWCFHVLSSFSAAVPMSGASTTCATRSSKACADTSSGVAGLFMLEVQQTVGKVSAGLHRRAASDVAKTVANLSQASVARRASAHMRNFLASPRNTGKALAAGLKAVDSTLPMFTADPPQVERGFQHLASELLDAVELMLPEDIQEIEEYDTFRGAWQQIVVALPALAEDEAWIAAFREQGDVEALVKLWTRTFNELGVAVTSVLPHEVGAEVAKYLGALEDALDGLDDSLEAFLAGDVQSAMEPVYEGLKLAIDTLMPGQSPHNATYAEVSEALDEAFQGLSETVLRYRQSLLSSSVCWKQFLKRDRKRPSKCPRGYGWDGEHWCHSDKLDEEQLERAARKKKRPQGSVPARCHSHDDFGEKRGTWCYKTCPYGMVTAGARCKSSCEGEYYVNSPLMCGRSPGTIGAAIVDMTASTLKAGISVASIVGSSGVSLPGTIMALVKMAKTFAYPKCTVLSHKPKRWWRRR